MSYEREVLVWPVSKGADADAYLDLADAAYAALTGVPGDAFYPRNKFDRHGQRVTGYFGPTGIGTAEDPGPAETPALLAARANAVLATFVDWPVED